jgi:hypothetical protein
MVTEKTLASTVSLTEGEAGYKREHKQGRISITTRLGIS